MGGMMAAVEGLAIDHVGLLNGDPFWSRSWIAWVWPTTMFILLGCTNRDGDPDWIVYTVKVGVLLAEPPADTSTGPVVAPGGTVVEMEVVVQVPIEAGVPLNVTVPGELPKLLPEMMTGVAVGPEAGLKLLIVGAVEVTVKS